MLESVRHEEWPKLGNTNRPEVLVVDDNPADVDLTVEARHSGFVARVSAASDGAAALDFLKQQGAYAQSPRPKLVLLDPELPTIGGYEVLNAMKADPTLRQITVSMLHDSINSPRT